MRCCLLPLFSLSLYICVSLASSVFCYWNKLQPISDAKILTPLAFYYISKASVCNKLFYNHIFCFCTNDNLLDFVVETFAMLLGWDYVRQTCTRIPKEPNAAACNARRRMNACTIRAERNQVYFVLISSIREFIFIVDLNSFYFLPQKRVLRHYLRLWDAARQQPSYVVAEKQFSNKLKTIFT